MLEAVFTTGVSEITVTGLTQWDRGQTMQIACPNLPSAFQVHFANRKSKKAVVVQATGENNVATVVIPDVMLQQPFELFAYLYFDENLIGETTKTVRMPVERRKKPDDYVSELTPQQATDAEKVIMKLMNTYSTKVAQDVLQQAKESGAFTGPPGPPGAKGDPFTYDDFTEEQLDSVAQRTAAIALEVANICYVSTGIPTSDTGKDGDICVVTG